MKCQILFSGNNKKNIINLWSAELAKRVVVKVKLWQKLRQIKLKENEVSFLKLLQYEYRFCQQGNLLFFFLFFYR